MTVVAIKCAKCGVKFGSVDNLWLKLGKHHIALITDANTDVEVNDDEILDVTGINNDLRLEFSLSKRLSQGQSGTIVANIKLREISCTSCHMSVGSQCVEIPDEHHLLAKGQYLFFATAILLKSARDGRRKVEPEVQQTFPWIATKEQPKVFSPEDEVHRDGTDEEDLEREESVESAESTNGYLPEEHILDPEVTAALQSVVSALGQDIQLLHDELRETRAEVKKLRSENNGLKAELENTKHQVEAARESAETANSNFAVYKGDIEKLVSYLENYNVQHSSPAGGSHAGVIRNLKRTSPQDSNEPLDRPSKRVAMTPEISSTTNRRHTSTGTSQRSSPIVSSASRKNGYLTRPPRRSSDIFGEKELRDQEMTDADHA